MSSKIVSPRQKTGKNTDHANGVKKSVLHSAAWRISLWATLAFACGTLIVFMYLHRFVSDDIQRRSDAWITGEVGVLGDVAERTPNDQLYGTVVGEVAELASREVPDKLRSEKAENDAVFFLQTDREGVKKLWVGAGDAGATLRAIQSARLSPDAPSDVHVKGFSIPFRVASLSVADGGHIYLGLSERDEQRVLSNLRLRFFVFGAIIVLIGFLIVFYTTRRMLGYVRRITEAASHIGQTDLGTRVPVTGRNDEIGHLALTLNRMLDRIESSMHQLHTITDALAHDLRSPLTAIRGKLEFSLSSGLKLEQAEPIVSAVDVLDRLTDFLTTSLDVAEARADALRLTRSPINLDELVLVMIDLYEPSMFEHGLRIDLHSAGRAVVSADPALIHRMISNLLDNQLKHLPSGSTVTIALSVSAAPEPAVQLLIEDDGPGFAAEVRQNLFKRRARGSASNGYGLGLAFVEAVVRAHGGDVTGSNRVEGGARIEIKLPIEATEALDRSKLAAVLVA